LTISGTVQQNRIFDGRRMAISNCLPINWIEPRKIGNASWHIHCKEMCMTTTPQLKTAKSTPVHYKTVRIDELDVFYREAGSESSPVLLLLHGFPTSSNMFRNLIPRLASSFRVIAPDYPGYGKTTMPDNKDSNIVSKT